MPFPLSFRFCIRRNHGRPARTQLASARLREQMKQLSPNGGDFTIPEAFFSRPERYGGLMHHGYQ